MRSLKRAQLTCDVLLFFCNILLMVFKEVTVILLSVVVALGVGVMVYAGFIKRSRAVFPFFPNHLAL